MSAERGTPHGTLRKQSLTTDVPGDTLSSDIARVRVRVLGIVQGVGFRPFVHRIARACELSGTVLNFAGGVDIEIEGSRNAIDDFLLALQRDCPPIALIDSIDVKAILPTGQRDFVIVPSRDQQEAAILVSPDVAICRDCERELFDIKDRRHKHPFINCTNCGPRFTIVSRIPYDRKNTSMSCFPMCAHCAWEYEDIENRRYHAQPNACHNCGPRLAYEEASTREITGNGALAAAGEAIRAGMIVAVKGIGGFHLACDAQSDDAVRRLRARKHREEKPLAIMVQNLDTVRAFCDMPDGTEELLCGPKRPIVLLRRKMGCQVSGEMAPDTKTLGVMLPYTPLHHLLMAECRLPALVMTSGNLSEEPLAVKNDEAKQRLSHIADAFLFHDRDIVVPCDDSVVGLTSAGKVLMRRARGYVPFPVRLGFKSHLILAVGGHLKNTFCLTSGNLAFLSQHIGDLDNALSLSHFEWALKHLCDLLRVTPRAIAHDLHPGYLSTEIAKQLAAEQGLPLFGVQHHHAHLAGCLAENHVDGSVVGVACDGAGLGADGTLWGFEVLVVSMEAFKRVAHLRQTPLPGGEAAIREPLRMAGVYLWQAFGEDFIDIVDIPVCSRLKEAWPTYRQMILSNLNCPIASSAGRLFDAISSILDLCDKSSYEGQAAMRLESLAEPVNQGYPFELLDGTEELVLDPAPMVRAIVEDRRAGTATSVIAGRFHRTVADMLCFAAERVAADTGLDTVALSGGTFQNTLLLETLVNLLRARGLNVLTHRQVPCNDGGISLGQAVVANTRV